MSSPAPCSPAREQCEVPPGGGLLRARMQAQQAQLQQQRAEQEEWAAAAQALLSQQRLAHGCEAGGGPLPLDSRNSRHGVQAPHHEHGSGQGHASQPDMGGTQQRLGGDSTPPRLSDAHAPLRLSDGCTPAPARGEDGQLPQTRFGHGHSLPLPAPHGSSQQPERFLAEHSLPLLPTAGTGQVPMQHGTEGPGGLAPPSESPSQAYRLQRTNCRARPAAGQLLPQAAPERGSAARARSTLHAARPPPAPQSAGSAELLALNRLIIGLQAEIAALEAAEAQRRAQLLQEAAKQREWERKKCLWAAQQVGEAAGQPLRQAPGGPAAAAQEPAAEAWQAAHVAALEGHVADQAMQARQRGAWEQRRARELSLWEQRRLQAQHTQQRQHAQQAEHEQREHQQRQAEHALQRAWQQHLLAVGAAAPAAAPALDAGLSAFQPPRLSAPARLLAPEAVWAPPEPALDPVLRVPPEVGWAGPGGAVGGWPQLMLDYAGVSLAAVPTCPLGQTSRLHPPS